MPAMPHTNLTIRERTDAYIHARYQHPAWLLLASRRGPLVLSCLRGLFDDAQGDVSFDDALQSLAQDLADHANHAEFEIGTADCTSLARKELRGWIKRELVVERGGNLYATDALEEAMRFVGALGDRVMTSTASRLSVVQREIESVEGSLNPDPKSRAHRIRDQIAALEAQLSAATCLLGRSRHLGVTDAGHRTRVSAAIARAAHDARHLRCLCSAVGRGRTKSCCRESADGAH
jgi:uncharacterized protein DUF3375